MKVVEDLQNIFNSFEDDIYQLDKDIATKLKVNGHHHRRKTRTTDGNTSSASMSPTQGRRCGRPANPIPRHKRDSHIKAEYKRRDKIQKGFDTMRELVPALEDCSPKESKSAMLLKTAEYCRQGKAEYKSRQDELCVLRQEIEALGADIHMIQNQLPAAGIDAVNKPSSDLDQRYVDYVQEGTAKNWKFWLFSFIMDPMFKAYQKMTASVTRDSFVQSVYQWSADHLSLTSLRPGILESLRLMCKKTSVMTKPEDLPTEALANTQKFPLLVSSSSSSSRMTVTSHTASMCPSVVPSSVSPHLPHTPHITSPAPTSTAFSMDVWAPTCSSDGINNAQHTIDTMMTDVHISTANSLAIDNMFSDSLLDTLATQVDSVDPLPDLSRLLPATTMESLTIPTTSNMEGVVSTQSMNCMVISDTPLTESVNFSDLSDSIFWCHPATHPSAIKNQMFIGKRV